MYCQKIWRSLSLEVDSRVARTDYATRVRDYASIYAEASGTKSSRGGEGRKPTDFRATTATRGSELLVVRVAVSFNRGYQ
jgi:hypothetical protein